MTVLYEDEDVLCPLKPPGMPCQPDLTADEDLISAVSVYRNIPKEDLYLIQRIDRPVGGVVLFGKNQRAAGRLGAQTQNRQLEKKYLAVVCGLPEAHGVLENYLLKNQRLNVSRVVDGKVRGAKLARLSFKTLGKEFSDTGPLALLEIMLDTGRHHQIRVQAQNAGFPLWGDTKYNPGFKNYPGFVEIGLYASLIGFRHPTTDQWVSVQAPEPTSRPFDIFNSN